MKGRFICGIIILSLLLTTYSSHPVISQNYSDSPCSRNRFSFKMLSPNDSLLLTSIATLEENEFPKGCIGIDVNLSIDSSSYESRSINYNVSDIPSKRVPLFDDGGYDLTFYRDKTTENSSELFQYFHTQQTVDIGKNWYNYINSTIDQLFDSYGKDTNFDTRDVTAKTIQRILYEDVPSIVVVANNSTWYEIVINNLHPVFGTGLGTPLGSNNHSRAHEAARYVRQAIAHLIPYDVIIDEIFGGNAIVLPTRWLPNWEFFDNTLQPYEYSIAKAKELLDKAGFDIGHIEPYYDDYYDFAPNFILWVAGGIIFMTVISIWYFFKRSIRD